MFWDLNPDAALLQVLDLRQVGSTITEDKQQRLFIHSQRTPGFASAETLTQALISAASATDVVSHPKEWDGEGDSLSLSLSLTLLLPLCVCVCVCVGGWVRVRMPVLMYVCPPPPPLSL
jgi:hypothetical protein